MPIKYKFDVLARLKEAGYSTYRIRREHLLSEATLQRIRSGRLPSQDALEKLCELLCCQPGDLLVYESENSTTS